MATENTPHSTPAHTTPSQAAPTPRFDAVGLAVSDMAASLAFYRLLGLDLPPEADGQPHVEAALPGGLRLLWDTHATIRSFDPGHTPSTGNTALAFACASPEAVDAVHARLVAAGHKEHLAPFDAFWGQRYAVVTDPDGNHVDLFAPLEDAPLGD